MVGIEGNEAEFCFFRPAARHVHLVGDFNQWRAGKAPMARGPDGYWRAKVTLPQGRFCFRYQADGAWYTDFAAFGIEPGPGGWNSVVEVV